MNELLRRALADAHLSEDAMAKRIGVDPKTVRRWLAGRIPYPGNRRTVSRLLGADEADLWPQLKPSAAPPGPPSPEILATYPHRWTVPRAVWERLFASAEHEIGILAYAGLFLAEDSGILRILADRARAGVPVQIVLGDPDGAHVAERGKDEGVDDSLAAKVRNALVLYQPLRALEAVEIRLHDTALYNSIYRADDDLLVNPHIYGVPASHAPVLHLRKSEDGDMASTYQDSFDRVWRGAVAAQGRA